MKKSIFVLLFLAILGTSLLCGSKLLISKSEKLPIFPFEIDGQKGFMNTKFQIVTQPNFYAGKYHIHEYGKYAAIATKIINLEKGDKECYLIRYDGSEEKLPDAQDGYTFIGDDYYVVNIMNYETDYEYATVTSLWDPKESYTFENGIIPYAVSPSWIIFRDSSSCDEKIINLQGEIKWSHPECFRIGGVYPQSNLVFMHPTKYSTNMMDLDGNYINDYDWTLPGAYYEGLYKGGKYSNNGSVLEMGFYNRDGERIIPLELIPGWGSFNCGVVPVISENGKYYGYSGEGKDSDNWLLIDTKGNPVVSNISAFDIRQFCDEGSAILTMKSSDGKKQRLINNKGEELNPYKYDWIKDPINGFYRARRENLDYIIDAKTGREYKCKDIVLACNKRSIEDMSIEELRIHRNLQYAKHGYRFKSTELQNYFSQFDWYSPKESNEGIKLTKEEEAIAQKCLKIEKEKKAEKAFLDTFFLDQLYKKERICGDDNKSYYFARNDKGQVRDIVNYDNLPITDKAVIYKLESGKMNILLLIDNSKISTKDKLLIDAVMPQPFYGWYIKIYDDDLTVIAQPFSDNGKNTTDYLKFELNTNGEYEYINYQELYKDYS